jgi:hypothetical protein
MVTKDKIKEETEKEHEKLIVLVNKMIDNVFKISSKIKPKTDVSHEEDGFFLRFLNYQGISSLSVRDLIFDGKYVDAFRIVRCIFENHLLNLLMMKGEFYQRTLKVIPKTKTHQEVCEEAILKLEEDHKKGVGKNIISVVPTKDFKHLIVTYRGLTDSQGNDDLIPYYYFAFQEYDSERHIVEKIPEINEKSFYPEINKKWQKHHEELSKYLSFSGMKKALILNKIYTEKEWVRISVHYQFLSTFIHPNKKSMGIIEGNVINSYVNSPEEIYNYDHYLSELALLYVAFHLRYFLEEIIDYLSKNFEVDEEFKKSLFEEFEDFNYFWFLKEGPHAYDEHEYLTIKNHAKQTRNAVLDDEIPYYKNPLQRLVGLHTSKHELTTGSIYNSPFHRKDALFRRY